jgi:hypothetical protein
MEHTEIPILKVRNGDRQTGGEGKFSEEYPLATVDVCRTSLEEANYGKVNTQRTLVSVKHLCVRGIRPGKIQGQFPGAQEGREQLHGEQDRKEKQQEDDLC